MRLLSEIRERLRALFNRESGERELEEELRFHLEMQAEEYVRQGMDPTEARRRAVLAFGGVERAKEEVRDARSFGLLHRVASDLGYAVRSFRSGRSGLLVSGVVLAVSIGAGTTVFSVVSAVLLDSLPFTDSDRLVNVRVAPLTMRTESTAGATMSQQSVELVLSGTGAFESAAYLRPAGEPVLTGIGEPERIQAWSVAPSFFEVLGSRPLLGRTLTAADGAETEGSPVVLSHRLWISRFGGTPDVLGRTLRLDGRLHEVVGVMPAGFDYPGGAQLWQPAPVLPPVVAEPDLIQGSYWLVARLAPGVSLEQARERLDLRFQAAAREFPGFAAWGPNLAPLRELITGPIRKPLLLLMGAVALVVLIACANVAAVLLSRGITRRREIAIRLSMGATRARVARQLLIEAVLLALVAGAGGALLAFAGVPLLVSLMGDQIPGTAQIAIDGRVLGATLAASMVTGLLAGLVPAFLVARENVTAALRDGSAGAGTTSWGARVGEGLVVLQVGLGTVLLTAALLLVLSFVNLMRVDSGFDHGRVGVAQLRLPDDRYGTPEQRRHFISEVRERAAAIPGVEAVAVSSGIPFQGAAMGTVEVPGEPPPEHPTWGWFTDVTPGYFRTLGLELKRGRGHREGGQGMGEVVVNESFVRAYFGRGDPIGRTVAYYGGSVRGEIVGVVSDARQRSLAEEAPPQLYAWLDDAHSLKVSVRTRGEAGGVVNALKRVIHSLDPALPIDRVSVLTDLVDESVASQRFHAVVASSFALIALLITALGVYGLTAYSVSRRSREIGIRLAIGATRGHIRATTMGRAALLAGAGMALGLPGAWMGARLLDAFVFGLSTSDPRIFVGATMLLVLASVAASFPATRRALRIDPMSILRTD